MGPMEIFWLVAGILFLIIEAVTPSLVSIWFALGAIPLIRYRKCQMKHAL